MAITTKQQRQQRRSEALQLIADGVPPTDAATQLSQMWGCSRRTSLRDTVLDAHADMSTMRFIVHTSDFANLLKQQIESGGGTTTLQYESGTYRINVIQVLTTSAATEGKVALLDMSKVNLVFYGSPHVLADRFSGTNALTGETTLILMHWLDSMLVDPAVCVIGSA